MNPTRDDDALNWAGDDDPTLQVGSANRAETEPDDLPEGWTVASPTAPAGQAPAGQAPAGNQPAEAARADSTVSPSEAQQAPTDTAPALQPDDDEPAVHSSAALVGMGILGGIYLLYTIGWFIAVSRISEPLSDPVADFMFSVGTWLAVAAPIVWFGVTFWLTTHNPRARIVWLLVGVVLLAPLPFILGTGVGA